MARDHSDFTTVKGILTWLVALFWHPIFYDIVHNEFVDSLLQLTVFTHVIRSDFWSQFFTDHNRCCNRAAGAAVLL